MLQRRAAVSRCRGLTQAHCLLRADSTSVRANEVAAWHKAGETATQGSAGPFKRRPQRARVPQPVNDDIAAHAAVDPRHRLGADVQGRAIWLSLRLSLPNQTTLQGRSMCRPVIRSEPRSLARPSARGTVKILFCDLWSILFKNSQDNNMTLLSGQQESGLWLAPGDRPTIAS